MKVSTILILVVALLFVASVTAHGQHRAKNQNERPRYQTGDHQYNAFSGYNPQQVKAAYDRLAAKHDFKLGSPDHIRAALFSEIARAAEKKN